MFLGSGEHKTWYTHLLVGFEDVFDVFDCRDAEFKEYRSEVTSSRA